MTTLFRISTLICVFLILSCFGCASRPDEQLKLAAEAMKQAADLYADQYAPGEWKSAKEFWDQAQDQLAKEQYAAATETLLRAKTRFLKARDVAQTERESMLKQVKDIQANIEESLCRLQSRSESCAQKGVPGCVCGYRQTDRGCEQSDDCRRLYSGQDIRPAGPAGDRI